MYEISRCMEDASLLEQVLFKQYIKSWLPAYPPLPDYWTVVSNDLNAEETVQTVVTNQWGGILFEVRVNKDSSVTLLRFVPERFGFVRK